MHKERSAAPQNRRSSRGGSRPSPGAESAKIDFFVSYASDDDAVAREVVEVLEGEGHTTFAMFKDIPAGDFVRQVNRGLATSRAMFALFSSSYMASPHCMAELDYAYVRLRRGDARYLRPVELEPCERPPLLETTVYVSLAGRAPSDRRDRILQLAEADKQSAARAARPRPAHVASKPPRRGGPPPSAHVPPVEATEAVLRSRSIAERLTREAIHAAVRLATEARVVDPAYADAWLAEAEALVVGVNVGFLPPERRAAAMDCAERASALDSGLPGAHAVVASLHAYAGQWSESVERFERGLAAAPEAGPVHEDFALYALLPVGQVARARRHAERAMHLGPARYRAMQIAALCEALAGHPLRAEPLMHTATLLGFPEARPPNVLIRLVAARARGEIDVAGELLDGLIVREFSARAEDRTGIAVETAIATGRGRERATDSLRFILDEANQSGTLWSYANHPGMFVSLFAGLRAHDDAFRVCNIVLDRWQREGWLTSFALNTMWVPELAPFRADPRFPDLCGRLGLMAYWQVHGPPDGYVVQGGTIVASRIDVHQSHPRV